MNKFAQRRPSNGAIWKAGHGIYGLCCAYNHVIEHQNGLTYKEMIRSCAYATAIRNRLNREYVDGVDYKRLPRGILFPLASRKKK